MKKLCIIFTMTFIMFFLFSCFSNIINSYIELTPIVLGDFTNPYISQRDYVDSKIILNKDIIITDAKLSLFEITEEEYNQSNEVNVFIESLGYDKAVKGRYVGINLYICLVGTDTYQLVELSGLNHQLRTKSYHGTIKYSYQNNLVETQIYFNCQYITNKTGHDKQYEFTICNYNEDDSLNNTKSLKFYEQDLIYDYYEESSYHYDPYSYVLETKVISLEEYNILDGINSFKQDISTDRFIKIKIRQSNNDFATEIKNIKVVNNYCNVYEGDLIVYLNDKRYELTILLYLYYSGNTDYSFEIFDNNTLINDLTSYLNIKGE